jgi:hypothetical protein
LAHRLSWELHRGPIPEGLKVLHSCDNPPCSNPEHLWLGTPAENNADRDRKGRLIVLRGEAQRNARLTAAAVRDIRTRYARREAKPGALAAEYGMGRSTIWRVIRREAWRHLP